MTPSTKKGRINKYWWYNNKFEETDGNCSPIDRKLDYEETTKNTKNDKSGANVALNLKIT